jgi:hypothetical protein
MPIQPSLTLPVPGKNYSQRAAIEVNRLTEQAFLRTTQTEDNLFTFNLGQQTLERALPWAAGTFWQPGTSGLSARVIIAGATTFTFDPGGLTAGARVRLVIVQDHTGGRVTTWPSNVTWGTAGAPALTTTADTTTVVDFDWNAATAKFMGRLFITGA